jgi:hypothetical protein
VSPQLCALLPNLTPMASMSDMHGICTGPSVLLRTLLACNKIHTVSAFTCKVVADLVSEAGETVGEVCGLLDGDAHLTPPPTTSRAMLVFVTANRSVMNKIY